MRALTVQQPYAHLIACGLKKAELRSKRLTSNERIVIHAGASIDFDACERLNIDPSTLKTLRAVGVSLARGHQATLTLAAAMSQCTTQALGLFAISPSAIITAP